MAHEPGEVMRGGHRRLLLPASLAVVVAVAAVLMAVGARTEGGSEAEPTATATAATTPPAEVAQAYLDAWSAEDWEALQALISNPELDAAGVIADAHRILRVESTTARAGEPEVEGDEAVVPAEITWDLGVLGETSHTVELPLVRTAEGWRVRWWYPTVHPDLTPERRFERVRIFPDRAPILGNGDEPLVRTVPGLAVLLNPARVEDPDAATAALVELAEAEPDRFAEVLAGGETREVARLDLDRGEDLRDELEAIPGVALRRATTREATVEGLEDLLGSVGEITAEALEELGDPYTIGDQVGRSGLERAFERRLAGAPELEARIVEGTNLVTTLAYIEGSDPEPIRVSLDPAVQRAGRAALEGVQRPAALVAVDLETAAVRAAVSMPDGELQRALEGRYPPGSTFKIVTATAALQSGWDPDQEVDCPAVLRIGGRDLRNAGGQGAGTISFTEAFARSCNTTFGAIAAELGAEAMSEAAQAYGFDTSYDVGLPAFSATYPEPADEAELAASAIGQGRVLTSPLHMASVAAAAATGTWQAPWLVEGGERPEPRDVPAEPAVLRDLMRAVVESGTGRAADLPGEPVIGKSGTAEFSTGAGIGSHAWFVAVRGDLAVAVVVEGGGGGGAVAAPLAAAFFQQLEG